MDQMQEALRNVPEDQRAMVEQMMKRQIANWGVQTERPRSELVLDAIQNAGGGPGSAIVDDHVFAHLKELGGFPVVTSDFGEHGHPDHLSNTIQEEQPIAISA